MAGCLLTGRNLSSCGRRCYPAMPMGLCSQCQEPVHLRGPATTEQSPCGRRSSPEGLTGNSSWKKWERLEILGQGLLCAHSPAVIRMLSQGGDFRAAAYQVYILPCAQHIMHVQKPAMNECTRGPSTESRQNTKQSFQALCGARAVESQG